MKSHSFEIGGGNKIINGKSNWPDCITIKMDKFHAWEMVHSLLNQLRYNDGNEIDYSDCGKLNYNLDE